MAFLCVTDISVVRFPKNSSGTKLSAPDSKMSLGHCEYINLSLGYSSIEVHADISNSSKGIHFPVVLKNLL